jgi:ketosteroid isomerase-like protein
MAMMKTLQQLLFLSLLALSLTKSQAADTAAAFPRAELEDMMDRWLAANAAAEAAGDWSALADFYAADAVYSWNMGPNRELVATGRDEIRDVALGYFMRGFERWKYPYQAVIIDDQRGTVIAFWEQIAPAKRADGSNYQVDGLCGSWFEYAGNYQWRWQKDFFDMGNVMALTYELAGAGALDDSVKEKMKNQARGRPMPLVKPIRPDPSFFTRTRNFLSVLRVVIFGR